MLLPKHFPWISLKLKTFKLSLEIIWFYSQILHWVATLGVQENGRLGTCLLYTSDAADEEDSVDLGGRRIIKKKKTKDVMGR